MHIYIIIENVYFTKLFTCKNARGLHSHAKGIVSFLNNKSQELIAYINLLGSTKVQQHIIAKFFQFPHNAQHFQRVSN